ncbi:hypothetical protein Tco_0793733 [Tanacetum coccineum]
MGNGGRLVGEGRQEEVRRKEEGYGGIENKYETTTGKRRVRGRADDERWEEERGWRRVARKEEKQRNTNRKGQGVEGGKGQECNNSQWYKGVERRVGVKKGPGTGWGRVNGEEEEQDS